MASTRIETVPYVGNEEWTSGLAERGELTQTKAWHPWYESARRTSPAGYATCYQPTNATNADASFVFATIRLAGHEVPHYRPAAGYAMIEKFLSGAAW